MTSVKSEREIGDIVWFGIGCFHFGYQKAIPYKFRRDVYVRDVKAALEGIPAIKDVVVDWGKNPIDIDEVEVSEEPSDLAEGEGHFPPIGFGWIRFKIYIPARVQVDIAGKSAADDTATENFVVFINYAYEGPVSYVILDDPTSPDCDPSTAVMIVREFLRRELDPTKTPVRFECLGPSPFHADCSLTLIGAADDGEGRFEVKHVHKHGYDELHFTSDHAEYDSSFEAVQDLFRELDHELGVFYWIEATEAASMKSWSEIQDEVGALLNLTERRSLWRRVVARTKRSKLLHDVFTSLIGFDVSRTFMLNQREQSYRSTYKSGPGFLREFVDKLKKDSVHYPTKQITTLVGFLEQRRSKAVELGIILAAAVIGGMAGATATHLSGMSLPSLHLPSIVRREVTKSETTSSHDSRNNDLKPIVGATASPSDVKRASPSESPRQ